MLHIPTELQPAIEGDNCSYLGQLFSSDASFHVSRFPPFFYYRSPLFCQGALVMWNMKFFLFVLHI